MDRAIGEECDDGNEIDQDACHRDCRSPRCGDGIRDVAAGEQCDLGAANSAAPTATCRPNCQPARCGDGIVNGAEVCDDGNLRSGDGCSGDCASQETCGNGYADLAVGEACDDGNQQDDDTCRNDCRIPGCGDGRVTPSAGEACDAGAANSNAADAPCRPNCQLRRCGDFVQDTGEVCDDGNTLAGDGCASDCFSNETCGNGVLDAARGENCDDGNLVDGDGCQANCQVPICGDGIVDIGNGETCDAGLQNADIPNATCRTNCKAMRCGDGIVDATEICDDGNLFSGDGCSADCSSNETCGNGYVDSVNGEECDDTNPSGLSGDGCSSDCKTELPTWTRYNDVGIYRGGVAAAYDKDRKSIIVFGGYNAFQYYGLTHEIRNGMWHELRLPMAPSARMGAAMAYDSDRRKMVLFGGDGPAGILGDTWEFDGATWMQRQTAVAPSARALAAMYYDPVRKKMVLFGGRNLTNSNAETWEYDGSNWVQRTFATQPPSRNGHVFIYDPVRQRGVLLGGGDDFTNTWEYTGAQWIWRSGGTGPGRQFAGAVWHGALGRVLLFGGRFNETWMSDNWQYDGTRWTALTNVTGAPVWGRTGAVYHESENRIYSIGGGDIDIGFYASVFAFENNHWSVLRDSGVPEYRTRLAFDSKRQRVWALGHDGAGVAAAWLRRHTGWERRAVATDPGFRTGVTLVYAPQQDAIWRFGGEWIEAHPDDTYTHWLYDDLWAFFDGDWHEIALSAKPAFRSFAAVAYDQSRGRMVLFGGNGENGVTNDTWEFDGTSWTQRNLAVRPSPRMDAGMAYDPRRSVTVLFGGLDDNGDLLGDAWEYNGQAWRKLAFPPAGPTPRRGATLHYVAAIGGIVLTQGSEQETGDYWIYDGSWRKWGTRNQPLQREQFSQVATERELLVTGGLWRDRVIPTYDEQLAFVNLAHPPESCLTAEDTDGDGLVGCGDSGAPADPDCLFRCAPQCPVLTSCTIGQEPYCGDGICELNAWLENRLICPQDCAP